MLIWVMWQRINVQKFLVILLAALLYNAKPLHACELALVLAVDVSGSVDPREYQMQVQGLSAGIRDGIVSEALVAANARIMLVQWTGSSRQSVTLPWTKITSFQDVDDFARAIDGSDRAWRNFSTAIGEALVFSMKQFELIPRCARQVIDISGDGISNEGFAPANVHAALRAADVSVNAIAIEGSEPDLTGYFWENVIVGPGAFVITATGYADYGDKLRLKLRRETTKPVSMLRVEDLR